MRRSVVVLLFVGHTAVASPRVTSARLEVEGDVCGETQLRDHAVQLIGRDPFDASATMVLRVRVERDGDQLRSTLRVDDRATRELRAASCDALFDDVALAIAIVLTSVSVAPVPTPRLQNAVDLESPPQPDDGSAPLQLPLHGEVALVAGAAIHARGSRSALLGARIRRGAGSLTAELELRAPEQQAIGSGSIELARGDTSFGACAHRAWFAACGMLAVGWLRGRGRDLTVTRSATLPLVGAGARLATEWALGGYLAVRLHLDLRVMATSARFTVDEMPVWESPRTEGAFGLSLAAHMP